MFSIGVDSSLDLDFGKTDQMILKIAANDYLLCKVSQYKKESVH